MRARCSSAGTLSSRAPWRDLWADSRVEEHTIDLAGAPVFYRRAGVGGSDGAIIYLHSVPTSSDDWRELLTLTGGAAPDLPGFGRSGKAGNQDYSLSAYGSFLERFLDMLGLTQVTLVGHGWGAAIALVFTQRRPERVQRLALIDPVPLMAGVDWPRLVRWWRRPGLGELVMGSVNRWLLARTLRAGCASPQAWPGARIDEVWEQFDQGTQRAILRLHRSADDGVLAAAGAGLEQLRQPALVVWGEQDPWLQVAYGEAYARRLPAATLERVPGAGHWPWLDQPQLLDRLAAFTGDAQPA